MDNSNLDSSMKNDLNNNSKKNSSLVFLIICLIIVFVVIGGLYIINKNVISENTNNVDNNDGKSDNKDNDVSEQIKDDYVIPTDYVASKDFVYVNTTKTTVGDTTYEINENKELVSVPTCESCSSIKIDLNGESAKYVSSYQSKDSYYHVVTLTEEGNLYEFIYKFESDSQLFYRSMSYKILENITDFAMINFSRSGYADPIMVGITKDNKYVYRYNNNIFTENNNVVGIIGISRINSNIRADKMVVYDNGRLKYIKELDFSDSYKKCVGNSVVDSKTDEKCTKEALNSIGYIVDENSNIIHAKYIYDNYYISQDNVSKYIISFDNKIYELTDEKIDDNYIAKLHNELTVKSYELGLIVYSDNTTEELKGIQNGNSCVLFKEKGTTYWPGELCFY